MGRTALCYPGYLLPSMAETHVAYQIDVVSATALCQFMSVSCLCQALRVLSSSVRRSLSSPLWRDIFM